MSTPETAQMIQLVSQLVDISQHYTAIQTVELVGVGFILGAILARGLSWWKW